MYFEDLSLCDYHNGPHDHHEWKSPLLAIGWLEHPHPFPTGTTTASLLGILETFTEAAWEYYPAFAFRGQHDCSHCLLGQRAAPRDIRTHLNLWIPGKDVIYLAPALIIHYIADHKYQPPEAFVQAVLDCPPFGSHDYVSALRTANGGHAIPLLTKEELASDWAEKMRKVEEWKAAKLLDPSLQPPTM